MKKLIILTVILAIGFVQNTKAQEYETEVELIESVLGKAKKDFVTDAITIPEESRSEFWNIYNSYEEERKIIARKRVELLSNYADLFSEGDNDEDGKFMDEVFQLRRSSEKNIKHYYKKIARNVSTVTALQFFQIEEYIRNAVNKGIYANLPIKM